MLAPPTHSLRKSRDDQFFFGTSKLLLHTNTKKAEKLNNLRTSKRWSDLSFLLKVRTELLTNKVLPQPREKTCRNFLWQAYKYIHRFCGLSREYRKLLTLRASEAERDFMGSTTRSGLVRRIPCSSEWTSAQVEYFRIEMAQEREFCAFFKVEPPQSFNEDVSEFLGLDLSDVMLQSTIQLRDIHSRFVKLLVKRIIAVTKTHRHEESAVDQMSTTLLEVFQYDGDDKLVVSRSVLDLFMSNGKTQAIPDVLVETLDTAIKLLVQEDKSYEVGMDRNLRGHHPEAQLIAEAIAAYQENCRLHEKLGREEFPEEQLIPGIVMLGTCPTFYLIPITKALAQCVRTGNQPSFVTQVQKFVIPNLPANLSDAILSQRHRFYIAQCLEAFRAFV